MDGRLLSPLGNGTITIFAQENERKGKEGKDRPDLISESDLSEEHGLGIPL